MIYINEECPDDKRALWANIIVSGGIIGVFMSSILRGVFIKETSPVGSWRGLSYFAVILGFICAVLVVLSLKETTIYLNHKEENTSLKKTTGSITENFKYLFTYTRSTEFIVIIILSFTNGLSYIFLSLGESYLANNANLTESQVNITVIITAVCILAGYITSGILGDRIGRKFLLYLWSIVNPICIIIVVLLVSYAPTAFVPIVIFFGIVYSSWWGLIGAIRIVSVEILPTDKRGTGSGLKSVFSAFGITSGLLLSSSIIVNFGLGIAFIVFCLPLFINLPLIYKYLKETKGADLTKLK